jgi:hypothetical protein
LFPELLGVKRFFCRNHMLLDDPDNRQQHDQHARAVLAQGHGQVQGSETQVDGIAAQPEHATGKQLAGRAMGDQGGACQAQLEDRGQHQSGADYGQGQYHPAVPGERGSGQGKGLINAIAHQQAAQVQGRRRHHHLRVLKGHGDNLFSEKGEKQPVGILNAMTTVCLPVGKLCEVFY